MIKVPTVFEHINENLGLKLVLQKQIRPKDLCDTQSHKYSHVHSLIWTFFQSNRLNLWYKTQ